MLWFLLQLLSGCATLGLSTGGGIAFWAHIGGFIVGWLIACYWKIHLRHRGRRIVSVDDRIFTFKKRQGW